MQRLSLLLMRKCLFLALGKGTRVLPTVVIIDRNHQFLIWKKPLLRVGYSLGRTKYYQCRKPQIVMSIAPILCSYYNYLIINDKLHDNLRKSTENWFKNRTTILQFNFKTL